MKTLIVFFFPFVLLLLGACSQHENTSQESHKMKEIYAPGLGEFMSRLQYHHNKLYFAGLAGNKSLVEFEKHEIEEVIEELPKWVPERPELKHLKEFMPLIQAISPEAVEKEEVFKQKFNALTDGCNSCHKASGFNFIKVINPTVPVVSNQDF